MPEASKSGAYGQSSGNPWSDHLRKSQTGSTSTSHTSPQRRSSRALLGSTGVSVPISVKSGTPSPQPQQSSHSQQQNQQVASHPYRMSAQTYAELSRSRSNSVQSLPKDELSDSSFGSSSPPSGRATPTPGYRWNSSAATPAAAAAGHGLPAAVPRHQRSSQEVYSPQSHMTGFRVSMDPASSAPSRRDTWASSSGSHHGHTNGSYSPPPPLPTTSNKVLPLPGEPSPMYPTNHSAPAHEAAAAAATGLDARHTSPKLELPSLKLDLDFGGTSLFDDLSLGSLGLGADDALSTSLLDSKPQPSGSNGPTLAPAAPIREQNASSISLHATPTPASSLSQSASSYSLESKRGQSWIDSESSPSTVTGHFDAASLYSNDLSRASATDLVQSPTSVLQAGAPALSSSSTSSKAEGSFSRSDSRLSNLDMNSSVDSLAPAAAATASSFGLPPGAARVPSRGTSEGHGPSTTHSRNGSEEHKIRLPPPRASSFRAANSASPETAHAPIQEHARKSSKGSLASSVLSQPHNLSKSSLQSPSSPTYRSVGSNHRSTTPDTTPEPSTSRPTSGQTLPRSLSQMALNKNLPPPPPSQAPASPPSTSASAHSLQTSRTAFRKPSGPRTLEVSQPPDTGGLPSRPNTAPQHAQTTTPPQKKSSLSNSASAASQLLARSKGLLHRSVASTSSSQSDLSLHSTATVPAPGDSSEDSSSAEKPVKSTRSSLAHYFSSSPPPAAPSRPLTASVSASRLAPEQPNPAPTRYSLPRVDSHDSTSSEEFGAAHLISMSTAKRDVERKIERQKAEQEKLQNHTQEQLWQELRAKAQEELHSKEKRHVSSKPPPPVDLDESSKRPSTDKLLEIASAKLLQFALSRPPSDDGDSEAASRRSSTSDGSLEDPAEEAELSTAQIARISRPGLLNEVTQAQNAAAAAHAAGQEAQESQEKPAFHLSSPPKVIERRAAAQAEAEKMLSGEKEVPAASERPPRLDLAAPQSSTAAASIASPLKTAQPKTPAAPPPLLWEKRVLPVAPTDAKDPSSTWHALEEAYEQYLDALDAGQQDRHTLVQASLLHFLKQVETGQQRLAADLSEARKQREVLFKWIYILAEELKGVPANRGTCLDGVAATLESVCFSPEALDADEEGRKQFHSTLVAILSFAVDKLNEKAVYANTLSFSGRLFAIAFFRIEGVGKKLLRLLPPVKRQDLKRIMTECGVGAFPGRMCPPLRMDIFPEHLRELCFQGLQGYSSLLTPLAPAEDAMLVQSEQHSVRMHGNWLIRWQASDSDLPFAFYRAYHRQLSAYLQPPASLRDQSESFVSPYEALAAPGYLFVAASLLEKVDSLIHRNLRSVTTLGPGNNNFSSADSANMSMGSKPKVLEHLNRRVVSTIQDIVGGPARPQPDPEPYSYDGLWRRRYFGGMLQVWLRALVKKTSLYDARGVFLLFDFIEGLFYTVCTQVPPPGSEPGPWQPSQEALILFDVPFILNFTKTILNKADNTIELMRTITFLYSQFETFTLRPADRHELCQKMLLYPETFQRLFLFWNVSVRGYFLRLLVWRVSRLGTSPDGRPMDIKDPQIIGIFQTLNSRLEGIRKRHDDIDPLADLPDDDLFDASRASVSSTRGVTNQSWFSEELVEGRTFNFNDDDYDDSDSDLSDDSTLHTPRFDKQTPMETTLPDSEVSPSSKPQLKDTVKMSKAVNWLKMLKPNKRLSNKHKEAPIEPYAITLDKKSGSSPELVEASTSSEHVGEAPPATPSKTEQPAPLSEQQDEQQEPFPVLGAAHDNNFFQFEFESSTPVSDSFDAKSRRSTKTGSIKTAKTSRRTSRASLHNGRSTPSRRASMSQSPRVSKRFSKRASILPPPALDLLLESSEPVPQIPKEFQNPPPYSMAEHPYAVRSLREYEDALDEFDVWIARVQEDDEELEGREQNELIPRLSLLWPLSFSESD